MSDQFSLPHRVTLLGEAMRPLGRKISAELDMPVAPVADVYGINEIVSNHLEALQDIVQRVPDRLAGLMADVVENEEASDAEVYRAVGRFEASVDDLLAGYRGVCALLVFGTDAEARDLLAGVYRHTLEEVRGWIVELVDALADPLAALKKRGLPTSGMVELPLKLTLTAAPQLAALSRCLRRQQAAPGLPPAQPPAAAAAPREAGLGFWGTVGTLILAWGLGDALFGGDDCGCG